ncbi:MAG TPA: TrkA C-terminal domain-containing protein [Usitatibacter sp.]|nr:TrkA C-terminal domain-containing protein [Usitatibacter sp.]
MQSLFQWLAANPFVLLFVVVLGAVLLGKFTIKGYGLGMVASAIVVGAAISAAASTMGAKMSIDNFTKSMFYYLFMYGVGLRVGPSFVNSLKGDGLKFTILAVLCSVLGLLGAVFFVKMWDLPAGSAGGILAGSMTMSAAIGSAEEAVRQGAFPLPAGAKFEDVSGMIALSYGLTYIWGTVGIILICKYLPRWWGIDAKAEARKYEEQFGVPNVDDAGLTGYRPLSVRAYRLTNSDLVGWTVRQFIQKHPQYKVLNVLRIAPAKREEAPLSEPVFSMSEAPLLAAAGMPSMTRLHEVDTTPAGQQRRERGVLPETSYTKMGAPDDLQFRQGDIVTIGGRLEELTQNLGLVGPEVSDPAALAVPVDQAEILVTNKELEGRELGELRNADFAGGLALHHIERGGVPVPLGLHLKLQRFDVLFVAGVKSAVDRLAKYAGKIARPSTSTDLLTLSVGMILGLLIGAISFPIAGAKVGLGNAGGLLVSGVLVSSVASRLRFFGNTPNAARNILEDLGLVVFIAIVGINAGASLVTQLSGDVAAKILIAGFFTCTIPPILVWAIGLHMMKINPAILMGGVAGARSHSGPAREAAKEIGSSVPWIGFPVGYAVSGILLTIFGYVAMILSK